MERSISSCPYPGCRDEKGNPRLTRDVICMSSRGHYWRLLTEWLPLDYVTLFTTMPKPVALGPKIRVTSARSFGHPAEWASDKLAEIADILNGWEAAVRDYLGHDPAVHPRHSERRRVALALRYLPNWFDEMCTFPGAGDAAVELNDVHRSVRSALGQVQRTDYVPGVCTECGMPRLFRAHGEWAVSCAECGTVSTGGDHAKRVQKALDDILDAPRETDTCAQQAE